MKYVICVPDGCADLPVPELDGRTPLEVAHTPVLDALAARATVGRAGRGACVRAGVIAARLATRRRSAAAGGGLAAARRR